MRRLVDVQALLDKLVEERLDDQLDVEACNFGETVTTAFALAFCVIVFCVQLALASRDPAQRGPVVFSSTVATPSTVYVPIFAGVFGACVDKKKSMEEPLLVSMCIVQPLLLVRFVVLLRDALRRGVNSTVFPLPLTTGQWRLLLGMALFHLTLTGAAFGMLGQFRNDGPLFVAIEAQMLLRTLRDPDVSCSDWERLAYAALIGLCLIIWLGGWQYLRLYRPEYRLAWQRACGTPCAIQSFFLLCIGATCFEMQTPQEDQLYATLSWTSGVATLTTAVLAYVYTGSETGWLYMACVPWHLGCTCSALACLFTLRSDGPLLNAGHNISFVKLWEDEARPRRPGATFIFFSLILVYLAAVASVLAFDPDESEPIEEAVAEEEEEEDAHVRRVKRSSRESEEWGDDEGPLDPTEVTKPLSPSKDGAGAPRRRWRPFGGGADRGRRKGGGLRQRLGVRELQLSGTRLGVAAPAAAGSREAEDLRAAALTRSGTYLDAEGRPPPPPLSLKRGPNEQESGKEMSEAELADMYDVITAGGGFGKKQAASGKGSPSGGAVGDDEDARHLGV